MLDVLDGAAARRWVDVTVDALAAARAEIDRLNVYPVPDGDTGTNLHLTLSAGRNALAVLDDGASLGEVCDTLARAALTGARGNSGIITAQLLRGWADELAGRSEADASVVAAAFARADAEAWEAVAVPVEGTVLSVSRAAAAAAAAAAGGLASVLGAAAEAAREALARTPEQLEVLRAAGVVDAGGRGLVVLLDALLAVVTGAALPAAAADDPPVTAGCDPGAEDTYEVMYLLDVDDAAVPELRQVLGGLGDSLVVVGGSGLWHVHVHTAAPGAAVEAGLARGRAHQLRIAYLRELPSAAPAATGVGVVAVAAGPGLAALFQAAGAVAVQPAQGRRASTGEVLAAVRSTGAGAVVVLPNDPDTHAVAQAAADLARTDGVRVTVLPTRAQVQGLAAVAVHDPGRSPDQDAVAMSAAAGATRHGAVTIAARDGITMAGPCRAGDVLGVVDGDFAVVGTDLAEVADQVCERLLSGGGELVTVVVGADAPAELGPAVGARARRRRREVEVQVVDGGQPRYPLLLGVE